MPILQPRDSKEEFAKRRDEIYERDIRPRVEATHTGDYVAIDIETGAYERNQDDYTATEHLLARQPEAQIWLLRVGHRAIYRMGGGRFVEKSESENKFKL
jgi:pyruvate dehydrogenase complex dehydrogenase (E1) component